MGAWLQRHRRSLLALIVLLAAGGVVSALGLPVGLFPRIDFPRVAVAVDAGDRPVERMITEVTFPLEQALRGVPDVTSIRSTTSRGSAELSVSFSWGSDMVAAALGVQAALDRTAPQLPSGTGFSVRRMDPTVFPVYGLSLTSDTRDLVHLREFAYYRLRPLLSAVNGVASVAVLGGRQAEYEVLVDPARLQTVGLDFDAVAQALSANNVVTAVGRLEDRYQLFLLLSDTRLDGIGDIRRTILATGADGVIELEDVAEVRRGQEPAWTRVTANGHSAVLLNVYQQRGANTVAVVRDVKARLAGYAQQTPSDIVVKPFYDQSTLVTEAAYSVRDAILIGAGLAALVLLLFLRNLRVTLIIALALPAVIAATVLLLRLFGMSFNIMTLGGMAAAVGLVVDDAVVMVEHIVRRLHEGRATDAPRHGPVLAAALEMTRPLAGSSAATVVVFAPLAFLSGVSGGFFQALALTMAAALLISFFVAYLAVPLLADALVRESRRRETAGPVLGRLHRGYAALLRPLLRHPLLALPLLAGLAGIGGYAYTRVGSGFMPHMDEGGFVLDYTAPPGTSLTETDRLLRQVESLLLSIPEVESYSRRTGVQLGGGLSEANEGDFFVQLKPPPRRPIDAVMAEVRTRVEAEVPGLRIETAQLMEDLIGDLTAVPQPIEVKLFGEDPAALRKVAPEVAHAIEAVPGVVEVFDGITIAGSAVVVRVDRVKAALEGLDPDAVTRQLGAQLQGTVASRIQEGEKLVGVRVWTPGSLRDRVEALSRLRVRAADGHTVRLGRVASIEVAEGQPQEDREHLQPLVAVTARIEGRDMGSTVHDVKAAVAGVTLPSGARVEYGGLYRQQQRSFRDLTLVFASAVLLVGLLLLYLYERFAIVAAILLTAILSLAGVFLGLWWTGTELDISAMMGMTMIVGIVTEVAVFFFAEFETAAQDGSATVGTERDALVRAGTMRMRPILMTATIAILALLPLALGLGAGAAMQTPLAIAIISGLALAVPLVLVLLPPLYLLLSHGRGASAPSSGDAG